MWKPTIDHSEKPLYLALANKLEQDIKERVLLPGTKLPPQRELADMLQLNLSTVSRAFKICTRKGLLSAMVGSGTYVAFDAGVSSILLHDSGNNNTAIEMGPLFPERGSNEDLTACIKKMATEPDFGQLFQYGHPGGSRWQMESAAFLMQKAGYETQPEKLLLSGGGQNAVTAILAGLFKPGDRIGTDPLTYPGIKTAASMLGIQLVAIPQKGREITEESLLHACAVDNIKGLYLIPDFHNPTTHTMSVDTRRMVGRVAESKNLLVIEDAIHTLLSERPLSPIASYAPQNTLYILSASKAISPGLRLAFIAAPKQLKKKLSVALYNLNISTSPFMAELAARMIMTGVAETVVNKRRDFARAQNALADRFLEGWQLLGAPESIFRWLLLPEGMTGESFEMMALRAGVQVYAAERFAVGTARPERAVRIAVTSPGSVEKTEQALGIIRGLLENGEQSNTFM